MTRGLASFVVRRLAAAVIFALLVSTATYLVARIAPGDETTADFIAGVSQEAIEAKRERLGLDDPLPVQVGRWLAGVLTLDLGTSSAFQRPVGALVFERGWNTARLAAAALLLALGIGLPVGILTGAFPRHPLTRWFAVPLSLALVACPPLVAALGLLLLAVSTGLLSTSPGALLLPAIALGLPLAAMIERLQSQAMAETLAGDGARAAAARGLPRARIIWRHAARLSVRPVLGVFGILLGSLLSGSLAVELVAAWPGLGRLLYDAMLASDVTLVAGCVVAGACCLAAGNLVADTLRAVIDPRTTESA